MTDDPHRSVYVTSCQEFLARLVDGFALAEMKPWKVGKSESPFHEIPRLFTGGGEIQPVSSTVMMHAYKNGYIEPDDCDLWLRTAKGREMARCPHPKKSRPRARIFA